MENRIYAFSLGACDWQGEPDKAILGGKGAGLVQMVKDGINVPPGFTITTKVCNAYLGYSQEARETFMDLLMAEVELNMTWLSDQFGYAPLVSVRSGAAVSMPGMMDTILNVGLTQANRAEWIKRIGYRATVDSQRRLVQMLGATAYDVPMGVFDFQLSATKKDVGAKSDTDLDANALEVVVTRYVAAFEKNKGFAFPLNDRKAQLRAAIEAVFKSWMNPRAIEYRKINNLSDDMGTAVTVQAMVFGNMGDTSGSGVLFTRDPSTGENKIMAEYLANAQGEDVVAGIRTPEKLVLQKTDGNHDALSGWKDELGELCLKLEASYRDMVDVEFTVQEGKLFLLQSRPGKRSARAAFKIAVDMVDEGVIDQATALSRLTVEQYKVVRRPTIDPKAKLPPNLTGLPACPGVAWGKPVFTAEEAINCTVPCILVTHETNPNDIAGMNAAAGILTQTGGATSHAAVVARAMDKVCITGCTALDIENMKAKDWTRITIDGSTGRVWFGVEVPVIDSANAPEVKRVLDWCLEASGKIEAVTVDKGMGARHAIMAAHWWGSETVLDAVLTSLEKLPSRAHITLDLRKPDVFTPSADFDLTHCFGLVPDDDFQEVARKALVERAPKLAGLKIKGKSSLFPLYTADMTPDPIPREYAAFTMLAH